MVFRLLRLAACCAAAGACTGPSLHVANPDGHTLYLDGVASRGGEVPFRYYGTTRWDAEPADRRTRPNAPPGADFTHLPTSRLVPVPAPASPWIFPLDFPLELLARLANGRADTHTTVEVTPAPRDPREDAEFLTHEMPALRTRAQQARTSR
jgi:hypothetical protein